MHHPSPSKTITTTMGPFRRANAEYNYSEKTLAGQIGEFCTQRFKPHSFKRHEASCRKQAEANNFEFMEVALKASLNQRQVDALLDLIGHITKGSVWVTLKNDAELRKACDAAAAELTPFSKHEVTAVYKKESWCLFKYNGHKYKHFYDEPWTSDSWWDIQSSLPDILDATPFGLIIYADKTKLSSFGTAKGYPVVVQCANLPVEIQNSQAIGGGCIIGWLPVVPEDAEEEGKLGYTTLKCVIWHESFSRLLSDIQQHSKTGYNHTSCYNQVTCWLFPVVLILSVDYEEQCMMSLIHGHNGKCPCPICLVLLEELHDISKMHPICTVEEAQCALHIYRYSCSEGEEVLKALRLWPVENVFWLWSLGQAHPAGHPKNLEFPWAL
ncbi:hypothetical protein BKA83DRAFT_4497922 [Pisolithus microcarpus]|nr:hypothetical protein BKA83DRAFT_4497922 [Pisolithus microcarpus]